MKLSLGVCIGALVHFSAALSAQTVPAGASGAATGQVEQSLRRVNPPPLEPAAPRIELPSRAPGKAAEDARKIKVARFFFSGIQALSADELRPALPAGGDLSLSEIREAADRVTAVYRQKGYALAFAYLPAQDVKEGVVEIAVVEGRIGRVLVQGNEHFTSNFILDHMGEVQAPEAMRIQELERSLLLLNEYQSLRVQAMLRPGDVPGSTDLYLSAEDQMPLTLAFDFDNFGSETVGENRAGATVGFHNLWESGHSLNLRGVTALDTAEGELGFGRIEYMVPFRSGTRLLLHGSVYDYTAKGDLTVLEPTGNGTVVGGTVSHSFLRGAELSLWGDIGIEFKNLEQELIGIETAHDKLRILILGVRTEVTDGFSGRWVASLQYRQGLGEIAGGLEDDDPDASRLGADGDFSSFNLLVYRLQRVVNWIHIIGKLNGQYAREPLVVSEQFALGGNDSVRGYPPFEFMGDRGYTATLEARFKLPFLEGTGDPFDGNTSAFDIFQIAAFIDTGETWREEALIGERHQQVLTGGGVGLRVDYPGTFSLRFDVAWPLTEIDPSTDDEPTFYVSILLNIR
ncbi:MAG TPA: ShlB/FhaC/HecB family hemolysin secretion/activation protein [Planctomycetota bacterium]